VEVRKISLPKGCELEISMTDEFVSRVRKHFGLLDNDSPTDMQLRMYVHGAMNSAIDKAEISDE
jgi:hypothetical protein